MAAAGGTIWRIGSSIILLSCMVAAGILVLNLYLMPASVRELRNLVTDVRTDIISQVLQPGRFSTPESGLTFHIRDRAPNGDLLGLLVHDEREDSAVMTYVAERGRILSSGGDNYLVMFNGQVQRYDSKQPEKGAQIVAFDQYMLDLSTINPGGNDDKVLEPRERYLGELIHPAPKDIPKLNMGSIRSELHQRLSTPLYPIAFTMLAVCLLGHPRTTRQGRWGQIILIFGLAMALRILGITVNNLVTLSSWAVIPLYAIPIAAILVAAGTAHVRMWPELRSKLSFDLKFKPANIKFWVVRGMKAK